jgi:acyl-CoA synthetase (AMP-forming)/AMP-acid ligase II
MIWTSPYEPIEVGGATLPELVLEAAAAAGDRPALIEGESGTAVSYATLAERIESIAAGLAARGFRQGDVLALWAPNLPQWAEVALGAMAAGGCVTGANPAATEREVAEQLRDAGASVLVAGRSCEEAAARVGAAIGVREVVALDEVPASGWRTPVTDDELPAFLPYSSGTTGLPKGVILTHRNLVASVRQMGRGLRLSQRDTVLALAPFFHVMGFVLKLAAGLSAGATVVTMARFEPERFLALLERHRVTFLAVPPPVAALLAGHPEVERHDLSSLELIASGGAPLGEDVQRALAKRFPRASVGQGWGMTETCVGATTPDRARGTVPGSVGRVVPNTELRLVDPDTGADLGAGERGELWVRGPQVMAGYLGRPDATAEIIDRQGWLRTGDLGEIDDDGNVFVVDRLKELIKVSAYQVAPAELEQLLAGHPAVADVAVVPRPDARHGEVPVAVVVPRGEIEAEELMAWVAERVSPYKRVRAVRFVEGIPRTPSGKVLRRLLVEEERPTRRRAASGPRPATGASSATGSRSAESARA